MLKPLPLVASVTRPAGPVSVMSRLLLVLRESIRMRREASSVKRTTALSPGSAMLPLTVAPAAGRVPRSVAGAASARNSKA